MKTALLTCCLLLTHCAGIPRGTGKPKSASDLFTLRYTIKF